RGQRSSLEFVANTAANRTVSNSATVSGWITLVAARSEFRLPALPPLKPRSPSNCHVLLSRLRGVKCEPRFPSAFVVLFFGPELGFKIFPVSRCAFAFAEMAHDCESVVD